MIARDACKVTWSGVCKYVGGTIRSEMVNAVCTKCNKTPITQPHTLLKMIRPPHIGSADGTGLRYVSRISYSPHRDACSLHYPVFVSDSMRFDYNRSIRFSYYVLYIR
jgi:hypothetical protein